MIKKGDCMFHHGPDPDARCPKCGQIRNIGELSRSKGASKFFCSGCCVEIHKIPECGKIEVYSITEEGELVSLITVYML